MPSIFKSTLNTRPILKNSYRFIRSDVPNKLSRNEILFLYEHNIKMIIDLRTPDEAIKKPCTLESDRNFNYINLPITGGNTIPKSPDDVSESYISMIDLQMKKIIETIENAESNVLYFCNAGKDRTGVVSAILLKRLEISDNEIIDDYIQSANNLKKMLVSFAASNPDIDINVITPCKRYMEEFLKK